MIGNNLDKSLSNGPEKSISEAGLSMTCFCLRAGLIQYGLAALSNKSVSGAPASMRDDLCTSVNR